MKVKVVRGTTSRQVRRYIAAPSSTRAGASGGLFVGMLKILGSEVPRSTAVLCTDSLVARPRGTKIRREVVLIRVLNSLGGNRDY